MRAARSGPTWLAPVVRDAPDPPAVLLHHDLVRLGLGALVLAVSGAVAARGVPAWEEELFEVIYALPDGLTVVLWPPMQLGSALAPVVLAPLTRWATRRWQPALGVLVVGLGGWWAAKGVKAVIDRGRPFALVDDLRTRAGTPLEGLGFVSGHATVAFAIAATLAPFLTRRGRIGAYGLAGVVALSRVHVGAHLPLDVVAGGALGTILGALWYQLVRTGGDPQPFTPPPFLRFLRRRS
jgi:membrane-associated phospholipid phosphatase